MRLLQQKLRLRLRRRPLRFDSVLDALLLSALALGLVVLLETTGPIFPTEYWDLLLLLATLLAVSLGICWLRVRQAPWLEFLAGCSRSAVKRLAAFFEVSIGVDFQPDGPIRLPRFRLASLANLGLLLVAGGLVIFSRRNGHLIWHLREACPYSVYLVTVALLWGVLLALSLGGLLFLYMASRRLLRHHTCLERQRRAAIALAIPALSCLVLLAIDAWLGAWGLLAILTLALVSPLLLPLAGSPPGYAYTIRRQKTRRLHALQVPTLFAAITQGVILTGITIYLLAQGYRLLPEQHSFDTSIIPLTNLLGRGFGCVVTVLALHIAGGTLYAFLVRRVREDPSIPRPTCVWTAPDLAPPAESELAELRNAGIRVAPSDRPPRPDHVDLILYEQERPDEETAIPAYPVGQEAWTSPGLAARLARLDGRARRRRFFHGLRALHREATARRYACGEGFFFAPHCWLIEGLTREESDERSFEGVDWEQDPTDIIGPPYHRLFGPRVRSYVYSVMRSCRIDLVFWTDGLKIEPLCEVLERLFAHHEREGAARALEERDLAGIFGVTTHIQEIGFEEPIVRLTGYPEPQYDDISRARALLVFGNRSDDGGEGRPDGPGPAEDSEERERWLRDALRRIFPQTVLG
ncbi:MAG: hypothetical protein AB1486_01795 [Planctomycetota bacterium]